MFRMVLLRLILEVFYLKRGCLNRILVAYKKGNRIVFLYAFAKNKRSNISDKEKAALKLISKSFMAATQKQLKSLIKEGSIWEVKND